MSGWVQALGRTAGAYQPPAGSKGSLGHRGSFGYGKGCPDQQGNYGKSGGGMGVKIAAHTMEYQGGRIVSHLQLRNYSALDYKEYKRIYEECFHDMRIALQRFPIECCGSREELERKKEEIYILEIDGKIIGSVAIYGNEIDDLVVEKSFQGMGYGTALLRFAVSSLQSNHTSPIILHVADWNQSALKIYLKNGFSIVKTEEI